MVLSGWCDKTLLARKGLFWLVIAVAFCSYKELQQRGRCGAGDSWSHPMLAAQHTLFLQFSPRTSNSPPLPTRVYSYKTLVQRGGSVVGMPAGRPATLLPGGQLKLTIIVAGRLPGPACSSRAAWLWASVLASLSCSLFMWNRSKGERGIPCHSNQMLRRILTNGHMGWCDGSVGKGTCLVTCNCWNLGKRGRRKPTPQS